MLSLYAVNINVIAGGLGVSEGDAVFFEVVIRTRFERVTVCLEGRCSIQLSYRTIVLAPCGA